MDNEQLLGIIRLSYLSGITDTENGCGRWCAQGSAERSEELLYEFLEDGTFTVDLITLKEGC